MNDMGARKLRFGDLRSTGSDWATRLESADSLSDLELQLLGVFQLQRRTQSQIRKAPNYEFFKRLFDVFLSVVVLSVALPLFGICAILIKLDSEGPVFFFQDRAGRNFSVFKVIKFRTMYKDADSMARKLLQKDTPDERATRVGKIFRKWKIDEIPQFFNVLKGEMSLVGPRPFPLEESIFVPEQDLTRFQVLPGMTGLWQATRPNTISAMEKFRLDAVYAQERSFAFDLQLIFKTIPRLMRGEPPREAS